jgi:hypothetical protein
VLARLKSPRVLLLAGSVFVFIVLLGGLGLWLLSPSGESASSRKEAESKPPLPVKTEPPSERMVKHDLAPFYIPLPRGSKGWMARVTLAVTWNGSSLKRFEDQQILARDRLYRRMTELAAGEESMRGISLTVRSEAQRILEELLRPGELHVVVTGIFIV